MCISPEARFGVSVLCAPYIYFLKKKKKKKNYNNDNNNKREAKVNWIITVAVKGNLQDTGVDVRREAVYRCDDATEDQEP